MGGEAITLIRPSSLPAARRTDGQGVDARDGEEEEDERLLCGELGPAPLSAPVTHTSTGLSPRAPSPSSLQPGTRPSGAFHHRSLGTRPHYLRVARSQALLEAPQPPPRPGPGPCALPSPRGPGRGLTHEAWGSRPAPRPGGSSVGRPIPVSPPRPRPPSLAIGKRRTYIQRRRRGEASLTQRRGRVGATAGWHSYRCCAPGPRPGLRLGHPAPP